MWGAMEWWVLWGGRWHRVANGTGWGGGCYGVVGVMGCGVLWGGGCCGVANGTGPLMAWGDQ